MLKPPTTYAQQIALLRSRGCFVEDDSFAEEALSQINYYRLSAYFLPFKASDDTYLLGTSFDKIYQIYEFDRKLRNTLSRAVETVEVNLRAKIAYYHAHKYGVSGYLDAANFSVQHRHDEFLDRVNAEIQNNRKAFFVQHHITNYDGEFPIWVIIELFTLGMLSYFYGDLKPQDQKALARDLFGATYKNAISWIRCCTVLRNICAHYGRLYYRVFSSVPAKLPHVTADNQRRLWAAVMALRELYPDTDDWNSEADDWNSEIVESISALITEYSGVIKLKHIGFPEDWEALLKKITHLETSSLP